MDVSIIIVNYNTRDLLGNCIKSIYKYTTSVKFEIIVVDNASTDGSHKYIRDNFPNVLLVVSDENLGFGKANNLGSEYANGEFLFFLNSDTLLIENSVRGFRSFFIENEKKLNLGVLGALLVDNRLNINGFGNSFPSCSTEAQKNFRKIPFIRGFIADPVDKLYDFEKEYFEIDYVIGADMFMRKSLFHKIDGFSKEFFMYYEESDLQKRIRTLGLSNYIFTKTKIVHLEEGSGKAICNYSNRKRIITNKSVIIFLKRNDSENFSKYTFSLSIVLFLNFLNFKYSFKENILYFKEVLRCLLT